MFESIDKVFLMTDLDGTLLTSKKELNAADIEAINRFRSNGGRFSIATGRTLQTAVQYIEQLEVTDPVIMYNGSCVYDPHEKKILHISALPEKAYEYALQIMERFPGTGAELLRPDGTYIIKLNAVEKEHALYCTVPPIYCGIDDVPKGQWLKILFAMNPEEIDELEEYVKTQNFEGVTFVRSDRIFFEMLAEGVSKGSALNECRKLLKNENLTFAAAGDFHNDVELVRNADLGAAPSNAQECVKEAADIVLNASCDEGAIAELISVIESKIQI
jgi:Cof subfamily protein (haloacid dehalogenase superfamily)